MVNMYDDGIYVNNIIYWFRRPERQYGVELVAASCQSLSTEILAHPSTAAMISVCQKTNGYIMKASDALLLL